MRRWPIVAGLAALAILIALALLALQGRSPQAPDAPDLETAAVERGLLADPDDRDIVGLYARDTDRLCIVRDGGGYSIGASVDYGEGIACSAAGKATRESDGIRLDLGQGCAFAAQFDGDSIRFPARVPAACRRLCRRRASLAALHVDRLSGSASEAAAMRTATGKLPCGG